MSKKKIVESDVATSQSRGSSCDRLAARSWCGGSGCDCDTGRDEMAAYAISVAVQFVDVAIMQV